MEPRHRTWPCFKCHGAASYITMVKMPGLPARILVDAPVACYRHVEDARKMAERRGYSSSQIEHQEVPDEASAAKPLGDARSIN
jgi:hypothetical protein